MTLNASIHFGLRQEMATPWRAQQAAAKWAQENRRPAAAVTTPAGETFMLTGPHLAEMLSSSFTPLTQPVFDLYAPAPSEQRKSSDVIAETPLVDSFHLDNLDWSVHQTVDPYQREVLQLLRDMLESPGCVSNERQQRIFGE